MPTEKTEGWIFDAYPEEEGMRVWIVERGGGRRSVLDAWRPAFHVGGDCSTLKKALRLLARLPYRAETGMVEKKELFRGEILRVLEIRVPVLERDPLVKRLAGMELPLYDADMHLVQAYHYDRGHFPLALCGFEIDGDRMVSHELRDDPWAVDYELPPLTTMHLSLTGSEIVGALDPNHSARGRIVLSMDGRAYELEGRMEEQLETVSCRLKKWDPDVITTDWGDSVLMPELDRLSKELRVPLNFSRETGREMAGKKERTFFSYGRVVYQGGARYLFGRWHLDVKNSFMIQQTDTAGLFEIARIAKIPVQRAARCTIGTSLSSMQMAWAWTNGILIPMEKQQAEDFRPATDLLIADKGGLVYEPEVGWHREVAEYDFTSMYPEMMVQRNISPETVNCGCCPENVVPEIGHHLCTKRRGLVPSVLAPILEKRAKYKALYKKKGPGWEVYKARADAHKWTLVCCFGYLGFKNARFGKIEAHECVTAWGREVLLRAKDAVERRGYHLLHALVDSIWIRIGPGADLEELRLAIEKEAECPLALEGVYEWIRYCPSKQDALSGVPGRYFGAFKTGELKIRGIASRRRDTPKLFKNMQGELLSKLAGISPGADLKTLVPALLDIVEDYRLRVREGQVTAEELAIAFHLSRAPEEYMHDTVSSTAAKQLAASGVTLHVGETVRYVITNARDKVKDWRSKPLALMENGLEYDVKKYLELLERAALEILDGLVPAPPPAKKNAALAIQALELPLIWG
ncbi:MAG: DNA polymerase domain-containing protein [Elusimicrobiota bacterium]